MGKSHVTERVKAPGRNEPCPCGSGRKYKVCCGKAAPIQSGGNYARLESGRRLEVQAAIARAATARAAGRTEEAIASQHQAVTFSPHNSSLLLELGTLLLNIGRPAEALPWLDRAVNLQPGVAQTHVRRGFALEQLGRHLEAAEVYRRTIELSPRLGEAHARLGSVLLLLDQRAEAADSFRRATRFASKTTLGMLCAAYALLAEGAADEAQQALRRVIALHPHNAAAYAELGKLLAAAGNAEEAITAFQQAINHAPRAVGHYYDLARIRRLAPSDRPLLERMLEALRRNDLHPIHRIMLELAIGKAYNDFAQPEQAMRHFTAANQLKGHIRPLDRNLITKRVDWQIRTFTPDFFSCNAGAGSREPTPLLILGMPRSGTTLVESVLACHSEVCAGEELSFWNRRGRDMVTADAAPLGEALDAIAASYLDALRAISSAPHVTDKKPDNFFWAGLIHLVFPEARIVHVRRNPLDTCVSIVSNFFAPRPDFSTDFRDLVFYYREYERLAVHWRAVLPADRYLELDYEAMVDNPEPVIRRLLEFCGLRWEPACLHPERNTRTVSTASLWQVRQPIFKGSVGRWRGYEPWLDELRALTLVRNDRGCENDLDSM